MVQKMDFNHTPDELGDAAHVSVATPNNVHYGSHNTISNNRNSTITDAATNTTGDNESLKANLVRFLKELDDLSAEGGNYDGDQSINTDSHDGSILSYLSGPQHAFLQRSGPCNIDARSFSLTLEDIEVSSSGGGSSTCGSRLEQLPENCASLQEGGASLPPPQFGMKKQPRRINGGSSTTSCSYESNDALTQMPVVGMAQSHNQETASTIATLHAPKRNDIFLRERQGMDQKEDEPNPRPAPSPPSVTNVHRELSSPPVPSRPTGEGLNSDFLAQGFIPGTQRVEHKVESPTSSPDPKRLQPSHPLSLPRQQQSMHPLSCKTNEHYNMAKVTHQNPSDEPQQHPFSHERNIKRSVNTSRISDDNSYTNENNSNKENRKKRNAVEVEMQVLHDGNAKMHSSSKTNTSQSVITVKTKHSGSTSVTAENTYANSSSRQNEFSMNKNKRKNSSSSLVQSSSWKKFLFALGSGNKRKQRVADSSRTGSYRNVNDVADNNSGMRNGQVGMEDCTGNDDRIVVNMPSNVNDSDESYYNNYNGSNVSSSHYWTNSWKRARVGSVIVMVSLVGLTAALFVTVPIIRDFPSPHMHDNTNGYDISNDDFKPPFPPFPPSQIPPASMGRDGWSHIGTGLHGDSPGDLYGFSVSVSGDGRRLAAGAKDCDEKGAKSGLVIIYDYSVPNNAISNSVGPTTTLSQEEWSEVGRIYGGSTGDELGFSVAFSGDGNRLAVGSIGNGVNGPNSGQVQVYTQNASNLANSWTLVSSPLHALHEQCKFGQSVSMSHLGHVIAIGAPYCDDETGSVRVFTDSDTVGVWKPLGMDIKGNIPKARTGWSVSLSKHGSGLAVGSPVKYEYGTDCSHVRVYTYNGSWEQLGNDIKSDESFDEFGYSVSLSDNGKIVAVGAPESSVNGNSSGQTIIYTYNKDKNSWDQLGQKLPGRNLSNGGWSVSLDSEGKSLAIGSPGNDGGIGEIRTYRFDENGKAWQETGKGMSGEILSSASMSCSGYSVSLSSDGETVVCGSPVIDVNSKENGTVQAYRYKWLERIDPTRWRNRARKKAVAP